ncbi:cobalamin B12-binding domain-containing protein [Emergencia sp.]|uniref:cobalamin B12-binding domain-containing protein n=1 Tax=Emergencia sp. TaxID=1926557 RepID=UPI003AEF432E
MKGEEMAENKYNELAAQAIMDADGDAVEEILDDAKADGITAVQLLQEGFAKGMEELGDAFAEGEVFLPELIMASEVMKIVTARVEEEVAAGGKVAEKKGTVVIGTVKEDVHDIGKSICVSMLKAAGFDVYDLGKQVELQDFVDKAIEVGADIIGSSALLTTTMEHQRTIEELVKEAGLKGKVKTMVGGAPVSQLWADQIGADGFSTDAMSCCKKAEELIAI